MKKLLLVFALLVALVGFTFALDADVQGSAVSTFGYNLETGDSGFTNVLDDFNIHFWLINESTSMDNAGEGTYGSIEISDLSVALITDGTTAPADNDDDSVTGTVAAKIHSGNMFVGVYNKPDVDTNEAENFGYVSSAVSGEMANGMDFNNDILNLGATGGMSIGYDDGDSSVEFSVSSVGDWDGDGKLAVAAVSPSWYEEKTTAVTAVPDSGLNTDNKYVVGLNADLAFGDAGLAASFLYGNKQFGNDAYIGFSVAPSYEAGALELGVGADVVVIPEGMSGDPDDAGLYYDVAPEVTYNLTPENEDGDMSNVMVGAYLGSSTAKNMTDNFNMLLNVQAAFTEEHDGGFVDGLGAEVSFKLLDILDMDKDTSPVKGNTYAVDVSVDYDVMPGLTPSAGFGMGTDDNKTSLDLGLEMGSDFTGIANTTFNVDYSSSSLTDVDATDDTPAAVANKGVFTFATTISW